MKADECKKRQQRESKSCLYFATTNFATARFSRARVYLVDTPEQVSRKTLFAFNIHSTFQASLRKRAAANHRLSHCDVAVTNTVFLRYCSAIPCTLIRLISELPLKAPAVTGTFKKQACTANSFRAGPSNECSRADIGCAKTRELPSKETRRRDRWGDANVFKKETAGDRRREIDRELGVRILSHTANIRECRTERGRRGGAI